ncbi:hypothetical protein A2U01_0058737, partial [Trifolium medium]|nr:hypothetical protein [Trifolium medium]
PSGDKAIDDNGGAMAVKQ